MITTLFEKIKYKTLLHKPELIELPALGYQISGADESILHNKGFIDKINHRYPIKLLDLELFVPIVIVPETKFRTVLSLLEQIFQNL